MLPCCLSRSLTSTLGCFRRSHARAYLRSHIDGGRRLDHQLGMSDFDACAGDIKSFGKSPGGGQECGPERVQVATSWVLGCWVLVIIVQVLGWYMLIRSLDP